jgi:hypothetical protein
VSLVTPGQLAAERYATGETFTDTCQRLVFAATDTDYGTGTGAPGYTAGASFPCSFQGRTAPDAMDETAVRITEADLYFAHNATLGPSDRVKITHLYGELQASPQTFEVVEGPLIDGNVQHAVLRLVTDGSDEE